MTLHAFTCPTCGATVHVIDAAARITCPHAEGDGRRVALMVRVTDGHAVEQQRSSCSDRDGNPLLPGIVMGDTKVSRRRGNGPGRDQEGLVPDE